jgi:hypothetical protein
MDAVPLTVVYGDSEEVRVLRHSGATNGQLAPCVWGPARAFALIILTNAALRGEVTIWALQHNMRHGPRPQGQSA